MRILHLIFIVSLFCSCKSVEDKRAIITGEAIEFEVFDEFYRYYNTTLEIDTLIGRRIPSNHRQVIGKKGEFRYELNIDYPVSVSLTYSGLNIPLIVYPGDSIHLKITASEETPPSRIDFNRLELSGSSEDLNATIQHYIKDLRDTFFKESAYLFKLRLPEDYMKKIYQRRDSALLMFNDYNIKHELSQEEKLWAGFLTHLEFLKYIEATYNLVVQDSIGRMKLFIDYFKDGGFEHVMPSGIKEQYDKKYSMIQQLVKQADLTNPELDYTIGTDEKSYKILFEEICNKHNGKIIYLDFWSIWCGPCRAEMPFTMKIKERFKNQPIDFIYICSNTSEEAWKLALSNMHLTGDHYLLTKKQTLESKEYLGIKYIPHYIIIDRQGNIFDKDAPRPSIYAKKTINEGLIDTLNLLLKTDAI